MLKPFPNLEEILPRVSDLGIQIGSSSPATRDQGFAAQDKVVITAADDKTWILNRVHPQTEVSLTAIPCLMAQTPRHAQR
jgi:hypothetical protein